MDSDTPKNNCTTLQCVNRAHVGVTYSTHNFAQNEIRQRCVQGLVRNIKLLVVLGALSSHDASQDNLLLYLMNAMKYDGMLP